MVLHVMSTFPPFSETFVMREIRELRKQNWDVRIGCLRPLHHTPAATGFEDLAPVATTVPWFDFDLLLAPFLVACSHPGRLWKCLRQLALSAADPGSFLKLTYVLLASARLAYRFRHLQVTLVRAHFLHSEAAAACFLGTLLQVPYSVTVYTTHVLLPQTFIREVLQHARFLVADTAQSEEFLIAFGCPAKSIYRVYNSVDFSEFAERAQPANPVPLILAVGRLDPKKGFHVLLGACALLRARGQTFKTVLIGEGPERERLLCLREKLKLDGAVEFLGKLSFAETKIWLYRANLFVMPSVIAPSGDVDGLPTVVIEAMASGLPVIASRAGAIPEAVIHGETGILVPADSAEQLADEIENLLRNEPLRRNLGTEGRRRAAEKFDLRRKIQTLSRLFDRNCIREVRA